MASSTSVNFGHLALVQCTEKLTNGISQDPLKVAELFLSGGLAAPAQVRQAQLQTKDNRLKASELVVHMIDKVEAFPEKFEVFLELLDTLSWLKDVVAYVQRKHEDIRTAGNKTILSRVPKISFPLQLTWRHGPDMPFAMDMYIQSVVVQGKLYAGGGLHDWSQLPQYNETMGFAMVAIKEQLVLVGGTKRSSRVASLGVWNGHSWRDNQYPKMPTLRTRCSAVVYNEWLIVTGGLINRNLSMTTEVLNIDNHTWHTLSPLPTAFVDMKTAVVGDTCYFMGGCIADETSHSSGLSATEKVFTAHLPNLSPNAASTGKVWNEISGVSSRSTPLSLGGSLLAVGGKEKRDAIHRYQDGRWEKVGNLPNPRFNCACTLIGDGELAIVGGCDRGKMKKLDIATIN